MKKPLFLIAILMLAVLINLKGQILADNTAEGLYADEITVILSGDSPAKAQAKGNASLIYNDWQLKADAIDYDLKTGNILLLGDVVFFDGEYRVETEEVDGNLEERVFTMRNGVKVTGEELQLLSTSLSYSERELFFQGDPSIIYKDLEATAETIVYNREEETALLEGNVQGTRNGYQFTGEKLLIDFGADKIILSHKAQIVFEEQGEE